LNPRRIDSVKEFTVNGGDYPNCIILNWVDEKATLGVDKGRITIPIRDRVAQIIDGQHRVEGMFAAPVALLLQNVRITLDRTPKGVILTL